MSFDFYPVSDIVATYASENYIKDTKRTKIWTTIKTTITEN